MARLIIEGFDSINEAMTYGHNLWNRGPVLLHGHPDKLEVSKPTGATYDGDVVVSVSRSVLKCDHIG